MIRFYCYRQGNWDWSQQWWSVVLIVKKMRSKANLISIIPRYITERVLKSVNKTVLRITKPDLDKCEISWFFCNILEKNNFFCLVIIVVRTGILWVGNELTKFKFCKMLKLGKVLPFLKRNCWKGSWCYVRWPKN